MSNTTEKNGYIVVVEERKAGGAYVEIKNRFFLHFRHAYHYLQTCAEVFLDDEANNLFITSDTLCSGRILRRLIYLVTFFIFFF